MHPNRFLDSSKKTQYTFIFEGVHVEIVLKCKGCGQCCISLTESGHFSLPLTKQDVQKLKHNKIIQNLLTSQDLRITKGNYDYYYPYDLVAEGFCPCFDQTTKRCIIYDDRPSNCKAFACSEIDPT